MNIFQKIFGRRPKTDPLGQIDSMTDPEVVCCTDDGCGMSTSKDLICCFELSMNHCSAEYDVYTGRITGDEATLEQCTETRRYEGTKEMVNRTVVASVSGGEELRESLLQLLDACDVYKWDGFHGANPPHVLDGSSMTFQAETQQGRKLCASGSNNFPKGYSALCSGIYNMVNKGVLTSVDFTLRDCTMTLPKEWLGEVSLTYGAYGVCFNLKELGSDKDVAFMRLDYQNNCYSSETQEVRLGRLVRGEEEYFLSVHIFTRNYDAATEAQKQILSDVLEGSVVQSIAHTIQGMEDYDFIMEDGSVFYWEDMRRLFSDARSIWLSLFWSSEYPSNRKILEKNQKKYVTFQASYEHPKLNTEALLKEHMSKCFDTELIDSLISPLFETGDAFVEGYELYIPYGAPLHAELYGNFRLPEHIDSLGTNHYAISVTVQKATPEDDKYQYSDSEIRTFEIVRKEDGKYVFKTFPFWGD